MSESERIAGLLQDVFFGGGLHGAGEAWHGPALSPLVKDLPADQAAKKIAASTHSIWELVTHIGNWNEIQVRRLGGERLDNLINTEADWPKSVSGREDDWARALERLRQSCETLKNAISDFDTAGLEEKFPNREYSHYVALHGIVHHIIYHTGQIALVRKALAA
jgi:uncharacterized damage-inducible protein DinB